MRGPSDQTRPRLPNCPSCVSTYTLSTVAEPPPESLPSWVMTRQRKQKGSSHSRPAHRVRVLGRAAAPGGGGREARDLCVCVRVCVCVQRDRHPAHGKTCAIKQPTPQGTKGSNELSWQLEKGSTRTFFGPICRLEYIPLVAVAVLGPVYTIGAPADATASAPGMNSK
jgi:hypothetical protein